MFKRFRRYLCKKFGWHKPARHVAYDGFVHVYKCKYCGEFIVQRIVGKRFPRLRWKEY